MAKRISTKLTTQVLSLRVASMSLDDAVVCAGVVCLWAPLVVFVILVGLAADGGDVSWIGAFIPLWIVEVIVAAGFSANTGNAKDAFLGCAFLTSAIGAILFSIFLPLKLDDQTSWSWIIVFLPLWLAIATPGLSQALALERLKNKNAHTSLSARLFPAFDLAMWTALVQTILLALSLEGHIGWDWQWLGLPLWIFDGIVVSGVIGEVQAAMDARLRETGALIAVGICIPLAVAQVLLLCATVGGLSISYFVAASVPALALLCFVPCCGVLNQSA